MKNKLTANNLCTYQYLPMEKGHKNDNLFCGFSNHDTGLRRFHPPKTQANSYTLYKKSLLWQFFLSETSEKIKISVCKKTYDFYKWDVKGISVYFSIEFGKILHNILDGHCISKCLFFQTKFCSSYLCRLILTRYLLFLFQFFCERSV